MAIDSDRNTQSRVHWLALKISTVSFAAAAAAALSSRVADGAQLSGVDAFVSLAAGLGTYVSIRWLVAGRLHHAVTMLRSMRHHRFGTGHSTRSRWADELDEVLQQVALTGETLEDEIRGFKEIEGFRREYIGDVSHELKTPIFAIQGYAETLLQGGLEDEEHRRSFVERIQRNAWRLGQLVDGLSDISDIEGGTVEMVRAPFDIRHLAREVFETLEMATAQRGVSLRAEIADGIPFAIGDRDRIRQVLVNLVDNGVKYNEAGGEVVLRAAVRRERVVMIEVADTGIGMAPEDVPRVTERFYRVDRSRSRRQGGSGLGLSIVKHILTAHGSALAIVSAPGAGSSFSFELPAVASPAQ